MLYKLIKNALQRILSQLDFDIFYNDIQNTISIVVKIDQFIIIRKTINLRTPNNL